MSAECAPDETILEFLEGTLTGPELETLEAHLDGCERCGPRLLALARDHHQLSGATPEGGLLARGSSVGRFVILEVLGRGAYGTVHTAYDPQLDRRLALKVLDAWSLDEPEQLTLVQHEARGMARVNHPNVVSIHDAGVVGGVPFVAMEYVAGVSLAKWLEMPRTEREILAAFHAAGEGLAAVHAAGLVHGDFRADNVLVGDDGRVRVTDFGLASLVRAPQPAEGKGATTAADDQHAFCLALQRALEQAGYLKGILSSRTRDVLARGLSKEASERFEDIPALLRALTPRRGPLFAVVAVCIVLAALLVPVALRPACKPDPGPLVGVWDEATRVEVAQAFSSLKGPFATATFQLVARELDGWRAGWLSAGQRACIAARDGHEPLLDELRAACLEESRREATVLVSALRHPDARLVARAQQSVQSLSPLSRCDDARGLQEEPAPSDAARRSSMLAHKVELAEARALRDLGRLRDARAKLEPLLAAVRAEGHRPLVARVAFQLGATLARLNEHPAAVALLEEAVQVGIESRTDEAAAHAAVLLVFELGVRLHRREAAEEVARFAEALVARIGDGRLAAGLLLNRALLAEDGGALADAFALQQRAVEQFEKAAPQTPALANALLNEARLRVMLGQPDAKAVASRALELFEQTRGEGHPNVGVAADVLGSLAFDAGDLDEAARQFERAKNVAREALGENQLEVALAIDSLARVALARGELERALGLAQDAVARTTAATSATDGALRDPLLTLAEVRLAAGRADEARAAAGLARACAPSNDSHVQARELLLRASLPGVEAKERERLLGEGLPLARPGSELSRRLSSGLLPRPGQ